LTNEFHNRNTITHYTEKYPKAKKQLLTWYNEILKKDFDNFNELKEVYGNASLVKFVILLWFGTHSEFDKIDVETIEHKDNL
jgi:mRNA interferase HigB